MKFSLKVLGIILLASILAEDRRALPTGGGTRASLAAKIGDHLPWNVGASDHRARDVET